MDHYQPPFEDDVFEQVGEPTYFDSVSGVQEHIRLSRVAMGPTAAGLEALELVPPSESEPDWKKSLTYGENPRFEITRTGHREWKVTTKILPLPLRESVPAYRALPAKLRAALRRIGLG